MKTCNEIQAELLLMETGELTQSRAIEAREHLSACSTCRAFHAGSQALVGMAQRTMADGGPSPEVLQAIGEYARQSSPRPVLVFRRPVMQVAAAAALLLVCLGGWSLWPARQPTETGISDIQAVLALVADDEALGLEPDASADMQVIEHTAEVLLRMQGLSTEVLTEEALWVPPATPPQVRSTLGPPATRYG